MPYRKVLVFSVISLIVFSMILSACVPGRADQAMMEKPTAVMMEQKPTEAMMAKPAEAMTEKPTEMTMPGTPAPDAMNDQPAEAMMDSPAWFGTSFTNVNTGETFAIIDFKGKVVLVEAMAQWCSTCLRQQKEIIGLHDRLDLKGDLVSITLDIDPNEDAEMLKAYAAKNGFAWIYAIAPAEVSAELSRLYGPQFINPPSAPMLIIDRSGQVHPLPFGIKSADDLYNALQPFLAEGR